MDSTLIAVISAIIGLVVGAAAAALVARARGRAARDAAVAAERGRADGERALAEARHAAELAQLRAEGAAAVGDERERALQAATAIQAQLAAADASVAAMREQIAGHQEQYREFADRVERDTAIRKQEAQQDSKVLQELAPVRKSLADMQQKVTELEKERSEQIGQLREQIRDTKTAGEQIRESAARLREVLRSNSQRGQWGELQLRSVVEASGMKDRVNFDTQSEISVDGKRYRPDMVINLPGGKTIAVDSKVPFNAYLEASEIPITAGDAELARRDALLKQHVKALRDHVNALSEKSYWSGLDVSPEMVVAFIPSESLLGAALEADPEILEYAFGKHVALASPVTLFSVLKAIAVSWTQDEMSKEAKDLFDVSRTLYARLVKMARDLDKLGRSLTTSVKDYNTFVGALQGSVLPAARRISKLDETKVLPSLGELDVDVREITGSDLTQQLELDELDFEIEAETD